jgi:hypothetical protein
VKPSGGQKVLCTQRSPVSTDIGLTYALTSRFGLIAEMRYGHQRDFGSSPTAKDWKQPFLFAGGIRVSTGTAGVVEFFSTAQFVYDPTKYPTNSKVDHGVKQTNGVSIDLSDNFSALIFAAQMVTWRRWLRTQVEFGIGIQARLP